MMSLLTRNLLYSMNISLKGLTKLFIPIVLPVVVNSLIVYVLKNIFDDYETLRGKCSVLVMSGRQKL